MDYVSTTELCHKYNRTASSLIGKLKKEGFVPEDMVIEGHHSLVWTPDVIPVLEAIVHPDDELISVAEYAQELNVDVTLLRSVMHKYNRWGINKVHRNAEIEKEVLRLKANNDKGALSTEHPLVTNPKFLVTTYFPNVEPKCFEDLDKEGISW